LDLAVSLFSTKKIIKIFPEIQKLTKKIKVPRKFPQKNKNTEKPKFPASPTRNSRELYFSKNPNKKQKNR
jgi:hypothetical protein